MQTEDHREIIIVKRMDPGHDDGHHGGVWKIAFADFMTAMMAFFLVMWLINAANEETKKAVASYFTPIKLTDRTSNPKGVHEPKVGTPAEKTPQEKKTTLQDPVETQEDGASPQAVEEKLLMDPFSALAEIAGDGARSGGGGEDDPAAQKMARNGGDGFQDLFDPHSWEDGPGLGGESIGSGNEAVDPAPRAPGLSPAPAGNPGNSVTEVPGGDKPAMAGGQAEEGQQPAPGAKPAQASTGELAGGTEKPETAAGETAADEELAKKLAEIAAEAGKKGLELQVVSDEQGMLIRLVDGSRPIMFDIGSAKPTAAMVEAMGQIGAALQAMPGQIIVSGHTDARQYKGGSFDNWQLSTSRAHMARYMLIRGGLAADRIVRVEGHADAQLLLADEPLADANRRIEVRVSPK